MGGLALRWILSEQSSSLRFVPGLRSAIFVIVWLSIVSNTQQGNFGIESPVYVSSWSLPDDISFLTTGYLPPGVR